MYPQQIQHKLNAWGLRVVPLPQIHCGESFLVSMSLQNKISCKWEMWVLFPPLSQGAAHLWKAGRAFFDLVTSLFSLGPSNKSLALLLLIVPLLHNPALSLRIRDSAQTPQMKLKLTTNAKTVLPFLKRLPFSLLLHWHTKQNTNYALTPTLVSVLWLLTSITKNKVAQMQMLGYLFSTNLEMKTKLVKINYNPSFFQFFSL